jgi:hypothetical protein
MPEPVQFLGVGLANPEGGSLATAWTRRASLDMKDRIRPQGVQSSRPVRKIAAISMKCDLSFTVYMDGAGFAGIDR